MHAASGPGTDRVLLWWQAEGFGSDSARLIRSLQREGVSLQILLFSATFDEQVRMFATKVAGTHANQVLPQLLRRPLALASGTCTEAISSTCAWEACSASRLRSASQL